MELKLNNIAITGGSGFIGSHLKKFLIKQRPSLKIIDLSRSNKTDLLTGDIKDKGNVDVVVHLAGISFVPDAFNDPHRMYKDNFLTTLNTLEFSRKFGIKKFIFISSYVYGAPEYLPVDEIHPTNIMNPYGRSKLICEELCKSYCEDYGIKLVIIRPFNIFGSNQNNRFLIPSIIEQAQGQETCITLHDLKPKRDFLYIKDLLELMDILIHKDIKKNIAIFNVGSGKSYSVKEVASQILSTFNIQKEIIDKGPVRKSEIDDCYADIRSINKELNWKPFYSLKSGLEDLELELSSKNV